MLDHHHVCVIFEGPPDEPRITGNIDMTEGSQETLTCRASDAYPGDFDMKWFNDGNDVTQDSANNNQNGNNRYDVSSEIDFTPDRSDNGNIIKCNVTHVSLDSDIYASVTINVKCKYT